MAAEEKRIVEEALKKSAEEAVIASKQNEIIKPVTVINGNIRWSQVSHGDEWL